MLLGGTTQAMGSAQHSALIGDEGRLPIKYHGTRCSILIFRICLFYQMSHVSYH